MRQVEVNCCPVVMDAVTESGIKCFHNTHILCKDTNGNCIPIDACILKAIVYDLNIISVQQVNGCMNIKGTYRVRVLYEFDNQTQVGTADEQFDFDVNIPLAKTDCIVAKCDCCEEECATATKLHVIFATVEMDTTGSCQGQCTGSPVVRIRVIVEKEFMAFKHCKAVVCLPLCPPEFCAPGEGPPAGECPDYVETTECPSWCQDNPDSPYNECTSCPPPQVTGTP
ncbi:MULTISPECIES: hypothetical protein [Carboxydothermus]|uniref:SipL SPOCS domain-containing protein n=2 Tax=Carboxydothermus TaxID=129957 RepID=Q3A8Y4_CARHZ|nr:MULTISPECIES: hypothetical protein [Carboxydothermus]ABB16145.1 hypothetical protein CHY_2607 [Carboxydothermus hydrogenoformans Z-2901]NYE57656.1 hypothetical protein [Carboxydothermus ferrireducens DSM 11255]